MAAAPRMGPGVTIGAAPAVKGCVSVTVLVISSDGELLDLADDADDDGKVLEIPAGGAPVTVTVTIDEA